MRILYPSTVFVFSHAVFFSCLFCSGFNKQNDSCTNTSANDCKVPEECYFRTHKLFLVPSIFSVEVGVDADINVLHSF